MKRKTFAVLLLAFLYSNITLAQTINKAKLDSLFTILEQKNKAMGSIALMKNGELLYAKTIGYSFISPKEKIPATVRTKYRIGSISKMFTAVMIFQLIEENKISLSTPLNSWFPQLPNANKITIGNLLNHHSGIHNFTDDDGYANYMTLPKTEDEMIAIISKNEPDFDPGTKFSYSNSNYVLLGYILEKITGKSYSTNLMERITSKIGLSDTYYGGKTSMANHESFSYTYIQDWEIEPETDMSIPGGAGAIVSTPEDLDKFIEALFSNKLVAPSSLDQMQTMIDGYGMGMFKIPFYSHSGYGHNGAIDGFGSMVGYFPGDSLAVAYCSNGQVYGMNDIMIGVLSIYFNMNYSLPSFTTISVKYEDLDKYLGFYACPVLPIRITISKSEGKLMAQATGQSAFPLEPNSTDVFGFSPGGIVLEFNTDKKEMTLKQGGGSYIFKKEN